jgi:hypothetical protein
MCVAPEAQAIFRRRRHQPRRPPQAKIRPGSPAPAMGPGTSTSDWTLTAKSEVSSTPGIMTEKPAGVRRCKFPVSGTNGPNPPTSLSPKLEKNSARNPTGSPNGGALNAFSQLEAVRAAGPCRHPWTWRYRACRSCPKSQALPIYSIKPPPGSRDRRS